MEIIYSISDLQRVIAGIREEGQSIGFVPTMGALHQGHASLIEECKSDNDCTICSVFVNPIQFNNASDLKNYPRNISADTSYLEQLGCDILFHPEVSDMYPNKPSEKWDFGHLEVTMEGKHRPGHFNGVATVVNRFFDIIEPDRAYFGMKDYQQFLIIKELVKKSGLKIDVIGCPTIRNENGLAMSSRNELLTAKQKSNATIIYQSLKEIAQQKGKRDIEKVKSEAWEKISAVEDFNIEYLEIADASSLQSKSEWTSNDLCVCCIALFAGKVRLIDNLLF